MTVNSKGGGINFNPRKIYITSNQNPLKWWGGASPQVKRRFDKIIHVSAKNPLPHKDPQIFELELDNPLAILGVMTDVKEEERKDSSLDSSKCSTLSSQMEDYVELPPVNVHTRQGYLADLLSPKPVITPRKISVTE